MDEGLFLRLADAISQWIATTVSEAGADGVVLGLSGGVDSGLGAALAVRALGAHRVLAISMPCGRGSGDADDALRLADHLGLEPKVVRLDGVLQAFLKAGDPADRSRLNVANIKARLRMVMLYAHSPGRLVQGTSNLSEISVGYWTKWGDGAADFQPQAGLYKDEVRKVAAAVGLPDWLLEKPPSAGLWPGQTDEGEMGVSYDQIRLYLDPEWRPGESVDPEAARRIEEMMEQSEHKRRPAPAFDARGWIGEHGQKRTDQRV
jgi:NAD+ synthase